MTPHTEHDHHHDHGPEPHHAHGHAGAEHDRHAGHSPEMFRQKFWLSLVLTVPVVVWAEHIQELLG